MAPSHFAEGTDYTDRAHPVLVSPDPRAEIDALLDGEAEPTSPSATLAPVFSETLGVIFDAVLGNRDREGLPPAQVIGMRVLALAYILDTPVIRGKSLRELAWPVGCSAAAISKHTTELADRLGLASSKLRSRRARESQSVAQSGNFSAREAREFGRLVAKARREAAAKSR